jgi:hypothetical protein
MCKAREGKKGQSQARWAHRPCCYLQAADRSYLTLGTSQRPQSIPICFQARSQSCEKRLLGSPCLPFRPSLHPSVSNSQASTVRIGVKFGIWVFFENLSRKCNFLSDLIITGTLHEDLNTFMVLSNWIILRMRNISNRVAEKIKTHILCLIFPRKLYRLWDNVEKYGRDRQATDDNIIRRMRFACWITKATDTPSEYVILIIIFALQEWLRERAPILRSYVHFLPCF